MCTAILNQNVSCCSFEKFRAFFAAVLPVFISFAAFLLEFLSLFVVATHYVDKVYTANTSASHVELSQAILPCAVAWVVSHVYKRLAFVKHFVINRYMLLACSVSALVAVTYALLLVLTYLQVTWPAVVRSIHWVLGITIVLLSEWVGAGYVAVCMMLVSVMLFKICHMPILSLSYSDETWETMLLTSRIILGTYFTDWIRCNVARSFYTKIISRSIFPPGFDRSAGMDTLRPNEMTGAPENVVNFAVNNWRRTPDSRAVDNIEVTCEGYARTDRNRYSDNEVPDIEGFAWKKKRLGAGYHRRYFALHGSVMHYSERPNGRHLGSFSVHGAAIARYVDDGSVSKDGSQTVPIAAIKSAHAAINEDEYIHGQPASRVLVVTCHEAHKGGKSYHLVLPTDSERDVWLNALCARIQASVTEDAPEPSPLQATVFKLGGRKQNNWQQRDCTLDSAGLCWKARDATDNSIDNIDKHMPRSGDEVTAAIQISLPHREWVLEFSESDCVALDLGKGLIQTLSSDAADTPPASRPSSPEASPDQAAVVDAHADDWLRKLQAAAREHKVVRSECPFDPVHKLPIRIERAVSLSSGFLSTGTGDYGEMSSALDRFEKSVMRAIGWDLGATVTIRGHDTGSTRAAARAFMAWLPFSVFLIGIYDEKAGSWAVAALVALVVLFVPVVDLLDERLAKKLPAPLCSHPVFKNLMDMLRVEHVKPEFPVSVFLSDAGFVDNLGLLPLLARQEVDILILSSAPVPEQLYQLQYAIKLARAYLDCSFFVGNTSEPDLDVYLEKSFNDSKLRCIHLYVLYRQSDTVGRLTFARPVRDKNAPIPAAMRGMVAPSRTEDGGAGPAKQAVFEACWSVAAEEPYDDVFPAHDTVSFNVSYGRNIWCWYLREGFAAGDEWLSQQEEMTDLELCPLDLEEQVASM